jgi:6-pyruvoyltetrahydropterin/6-carboxytetrahydropterin synthase
MESRYVSTKVFDNFSVAIRQHKAIHSHCQLLHGYAFEFKVWFTADDLDEMNWIVDFGLFSRNGLKDWLNEMFDHTLIIEKDDPYADLLKDLEQFNLAKVILVDSIGAESMAKLVFQKFAQTFQNTEGGRIKVLKVECFENKKNSGIYEIKY